VLHLRHPSSRASLGVSRSRSLAMD
jgi:hypothetical protein